MGKWGWFSANEEGEVVAKTEVKDDGTVHRYDYTVPDQIQYGHGHTEYENMEEFIKDNPRYVRSKNDPRSYNRSWKGNGYDLDLSLIEGLSAEELYRFRNTLLQSKVQVRSQNDILVLKLVR